MKRLGVAAILVSPGGAYVVLGRRKKDPNRGKYVLPGGGVQEGESLDQALTREVFEETGLRVRPGSSRWEDVHVVELEDRIILFVEAVAEGRPMSGTDLSDVAWFLASRLPKDISPVVVPVLKSHGFEFETEEEES